MSGPTYSPVQLRAEGHKEAFRLMRYEMVWTGATRTAAALEMLKMAHSRAHEWRKAFTDGFIGAMEGVIRE